MDRLEREIHGALQYLLAATQTKNHFSRLPNDKNNRELMKHQLKVQKKLFEQFPLEMRLAAKDRYDALESKGAAAQIPMASLNVADVGSTCTADEPAEFLLRQVQLLPALRYSHR